jgi:hypothetical protein
VSDPLGSLSPDARAILEAGRDGDSAGDLERARVRRALMATIAAGGGAALATTSAAAASGPTAAGTATATGTALSAKILVPLAILAAGGVGAGVAWQAHGPATAPAAVHRVALPAPAPAIAPPPVVFEAPAPAAPKAEPRAHRTHVAAPVREPAPTNRLAEETALLGSANGALRAGDARRALGLLDDYDHRYPSGVLREEVLATRLIARCQLAGAQGDSLDDTAARARTEARAFLARHPASPLAPRVRSSCAR